MFVDDYYQSILKNVQELSRDEVKSMKSILSKHNAEASDNHFVDNQNTLNFIENRYDGLTERIESLKNIKSFEQIISEKKITISNTDSNRKLVP